MTAIVKIDWMRVVLNIRQVTSVAKAAKMIGMNAETLNNYARGVAIEPKFSNGIAMLDLHYKLCPEKHDMEKLSKV